MSLRVRHLFLFIILAHSVPVYPAIVCDRTMEKIKQVTKSAAYHSTKIYLYPLFFLGEAIEKSLSKKDFKSELGIPYELLKEDWLHLTAFILWTALKSQEDALEMGLTYSPLVGLPPEPPEGIQPDLFLDGAALADHLYNWILANCPKEQLDKHHFYVLSARLFFGYAFREKEHLERKALRQWMNNQPDGSIKPDQLYKQAFRITNCDIESASTLVWDELREDWLNRKERNSFTHILKLADITGEKALLDHNYSENIQGLGRFTGLPIPRAKSIRGDNFSAWYHLSGTALNALINARSASTLYSPTIANEYTKRLIQLEEHVLFDEFVDPQKRHSIDYAGAEFGTQLARRLSSKKRPEGPLKNYLYLNPKVYGEKWKLTGPAKDYSYSLLRDARAEERREIELREGRYGYHLLQMVLDGLQGNGVFEQ